MTHSTPIISTILCPVCRGRRCGACKDTGYVRHVEFAVPRPPRYEPGDAFADPVTVYEGPIRKGYAR